MSTSYYLYRKVGKSLEESLEKKILIGVRTWEEKAVFRFSMPIAEFIDKVNEFHGVIDEFMDFTDIHLFVVRDLAQCDLIVYDKENIPA